MSIDLRAMRWVIAVAEEGSFTQAARRLHMAQPPLSRGIQQVERELGVTLFNRRPTRLTEPGRVFVEAARRTLGEADRTLEQTRRAAAGQLGTVRIGYTPMMAYDIMPALVARVAEALPDLELVAEEVWDVDLTRGLADHRFDLGLGFQVPAPQGFRRVPIGQEPYVIIIGPGHRLARRRRVRLAELRDETFRFFPRPLAPAYYDAVLAALSLTGERFEVWASPTPGMRNIRTRHSRTGFTMVPRSIAAHLPGLRTLAVSDDLPLSRIDLILPANIGSAVAQVADLVTDSS